MKIILKLKLSRRAGALLPGQSPGSAFYIPAPREKGRKTFMSREKIENTLFDLKMAVWHISDGRTAENLSGDIAWYIQTGRASCDYIRAFCALSKYRINTLARKILDCGCTDDVIAASKKYLKISQ